MHAASRPTGAPTLEQAQRGALVLDQLRSLPAPSQDILQLIEYVASSPPPTDRLLALVRSDDDLAARIAGIAQPTGSARARNVESLAQSVGRIGPSAICRALLVRRLKGTFEGADVEVGGLSVFQFWRHGLAVACAAELIADLSPDTPAVAHAFSAGLLHDVGRLALARVFPKSYRRVLRRAARGDAHLCDVERELIGSDHTAAGRELAARWHWPEASASAMWLHHQRCDLLPATVKHRELVAVVCAAVRLGDPWRVEPDARGPYEALCAEDALAVGLDAAKLDELDQALRQRVAALIELAGLDRDVTPRPARDPAPDPKRSTPSPARPRLDARVACLDAVDRFWSAASATDCVIDVCAAAARAFAPLVNKERTAAFVRTPGGRLVHAVAQDHTHESHATGALLAMTEQQDAALVEALEACAPGQIVTAPDTMRVLWHRATGARAGGCVWALAILDGNEPVGAVLFLADDPSVQMLSAQTSALATFGRAVGVSVKFAWARREIEQLNEELLGATRRTGDSRAHLIRQRSISMIARMAAGAAHELNNPLAVISGRAQMLLGRCEDTEQSRQVEVIIEQTQRAADIVLNLMQFAKPDPPNPVRIDLDRMLRSVCQYWQRHSSIGSDRLTVSMAEADAVVFADEDHFRAILDALIANAIEASPSETARVQINSPPAVSDDTHRVVVVDNGRGMTREVLEHAVDPFFSSRPAGRGRGLGLSRAYRLAEINGGRLWIDSAVGKGTRVTIELPRRAQRS